MSDSSSEAANLKDREHSVRQPEDVARELEALEKSDHPEALYKLGVLHHQIGNSQRALDYLERAAGHPFLLPRARARQATILKQLSRPKEAFPMALQSIKADISLTEAWECAGALLLAHKRWTEAGQLLQLSIAHHSQNATLHAYYAIALAKSGNPVLAYAHVRHALQLQPDLRLALLARIETLSEAGHYDVALKDAAFLKDSHGSEAAASNFSFGSLSFMTGDYARGMKTLVGFINSGWRGGDIPEWNGENLEDQSIVLYGGQGYGDMIQFARYIQPLFSHMHNVWLQVPRNLTRLFKDSFPNLKISIHQDEAGHQSAPMPSETMIGLPPDIKRRSSLPSLSNFIEGGFDAMVQQTPYLRVRADLAATWRERLAHIPRPWIGVVWAPGTWFSSNPNRTLSYETLSPLVKCARSHLISLQLGDQAEKVTADGLYNASPLIADFADSAALVSELDLLITFDSAPAHLAGALAKPVWTMLPFNADWRWLVGREDTLWYPTMRLFRQRHPNDWSDVIGRITVELQKFLAGNESVLKAEPWVGPTPVCSPDALHLPD